jgi:hypothetical protein
MSNKKADFAYASITSQLANWDDDDDDDVDMNLVSKRQSGAFSPMANSARSPATATATATPARSAKKSPYNFKQSMRPSPMATPAGISHAQTPMNMNPNVSMDDDKEEGDGDGDGFDGDDNINMDLNHDFEDGTTSRPSFINQASLDGDYRPYHDALLALRSASASSRQDQGQGQGDIGTASLIQYLERIMTSAYSRSTLLGDTIHAETTTEGASAIASSSSMESTKQQLEHEGHFWALIFNLMKGERADEDNNHDNHNHNDNLLLYQTPSTSSIKREVQSFISNLIASHGHLDPAALAYLLQQCLEEDHIGIGTPSIVQRRQIILDWIQSCHNRSISALDLDGRDGGGNKENVMWKDTTQKLNQKQHSFLTSESGQNGSDQVQEIHPDAPYQSGALYGKDPEREVDLLHKCLLLIKAGRTSDAFELCERMGQPWRSAAWDGDAPHGYVDMAAMNMNVDVGVDADMNVDAGDDNDNESANESGGAKTRTKVGNPQRALWKRNMWEVSASLSSMLQPHKGGGNDNDNGNGNDGTSKGGSGSVVYEAAIAAILADDTKTASRNPLLAKNWMDLVWIFYRGHQARFMELIYNAHNNVRRIGSDVVKYPLEGTEFKREEEEQLTCTAEMSRLEEGAFLSRLSQQSPSQSSSHGQGELKKGISAFLTGIQDVQRYLMGTMDTLIHASDPDGQVKMSQEEYEPLLRFILHLVLFFDSFCSNNDGTSPASVFHSNVIAPRYNQLVLVYLQQLMEQKPLWGFTSLYASLLPEDQMISVCCEFWSSSVFEEKDRRMMLKHAREYFDDGLDLVILRDIVRMSFQSVHEDQFYEPLSVASWLGTEKASFNDQQLFDPELEFMISPDDVRKMHSIRWLGLYNEHYADALICANMLMRNLLLELPTPSLEENDEDTYDDWVDSIKLYTAKVLQSRFLPSDIAQVAMGSINDDVSSPEHKLDKEDVEDYVAEYDALAQFFDAHNAYQSWKDVVAEISPSVPFVRDTRFAESSVESDVAMNMEIMKYVKKKKDIAQRLIKIAEVAKDSLMQVLEYDNGWLYLEHGDATITDAIDEVSRRKKEMHDLRCKVLPAVVSLAFSVCHNTACWMDEFTIDIYDVFGDKSVDVISRITSKASFEADGLENPFQASNWHRMSLLLANTVASSDTKIAESMSQNELSAFMNCMVETNICLLVDQDLKNN